MTPDQLQRLLVEYDDVTSDVLAASSATFESNLERWFEWLESVPVIAKLIGTLESLVDFPAWLKTGEATMGSFIGSGQLRWPKGIQRLAMQLSLFKAISTGSYSYIDLHTTFFGGSNYYDDMISDVTRQIFEPMSRDLRHELTKTFAIGTGEVDLMAIPASDRIVRLDHNNMDYRIATEDLERLENVVSGSNDYADIDDKEQRIAELGAMRRLLRSARVRADVFITVFYHGLQHFAKTFYDKAIGLLALGILALLGRLTGLW